MSTKEVAFGGFVIAFSLAFFTGLFADTLVLSNGDQLTGTVISETETELVFHSELLGKLVVPKVSVASVQRDAGESVSEPESLIRAKVNQIAPALEPTLLAEEPGVFLKTLDFINPFKGWESKLSLGYSWFGGETSRHNWFILFEANRKFTHSEWKVRGRWDYSSTRLDKDTALKTEDRFQTALQYRRNWAERWFTQSRTHYQKDQIRRIKHDFEQSLGIGWRMLDNPGLRILWIPSYTLRYRDLAGQEPGWQSRFSLFQELQYDIHPRVILRQDASIGFEPSETSRADYYFGVNLENRITERLSVDLRFEYRFQYLTGLGVDGHERKFLAAMGYRF